jgi:hypothetical protein
MVPARMPVRKLSAGALAALVLAGCGASASTTTTTGSTGTTGATTANTRAEFIAKADALCEATHSRQVALRTDAKGKTVSQLVPLLHQQASIAKGLATSIGALTPPVGDTAAVGRFVHAITELSVFSTALANSIHADHAYAAQALEQKLESWHEQEALLGQGYGYKICANGVSY